VEGRIGLTSRSKERVFREKWEVAEISLNRWNGTLQKKKQRKRGKESEVKNWKKNIDIERWRK
jgi:hypothetical protein